jgi:hypothetical protein
MPSLRDKTHDGWLCTGCVPLLYNSSCSTSSQLGSSWQGNRHGTEKAGVKARPSRTKSHLPGHSPPASQRAALLDQPSKIQLHCCQTADLRPPLSHFTKRMERTQSLDAVARCRRIPACRKTELARPRHVIFCDMVTPGDDKSELLMPSYRLSETRKIPESDFGWTKSSQKCLSC